MVSLKKTRPKTQAPWYQERVAARRKLDQDINTLTTESEGTRKIARYQKQDKQQRYAEDMKRLDKVPEGVSSDLGYSLWGNKRLRTEKSGELIRERGIFRKTTKVVQRGDEPGTVHVSKLEKDSWRKNTSSTFDKKGNLLTKSVERKDNTYDEKWSRDENNKLIRTQYYSFRLRDGRFFRPVSENLSGPNEQGYRTLTRKKGRNEKVFERAPDGTLRLISRKKTGYSKKVDISEDRKTAIVTKKRLGGLFSKVYQARLDPNGNTISKDIISRRRGWSKISAAYGKDGALETTTHDTAKIFKTNTKFHEVVKPDAVVNSTYVTKKLFGLELKSDFTNGPTGYLKDKQLRIDEAKAHEKAWSSVSVPSPSNKDSAFEETKPQPPGRKNTAQSDKTLVNEPSIDPEMDSSAPVNGRPSNLDRINKARALSSVSPLQADTSEASNLDKINKARAISSVSPLQANTSQSPTPQKSQSSIDSSDTSVVGVQPKGPEAAQALKKSAMAAALARRNASGVAPNQANIQGASIQQKPGADAGAGITAPSVKPPLRLKNAPYQGDTNSQNLKKLMDAVANREAKVIAGDAPPPPQSKKDVMLEAMKRRQTAALQPRDSLADTTSRGSLDERPTVLSR